MRLSRIIQSLQMPTKWIMCHQTFTLHLLKMVSTVDSPYLEVHVQGVL